MSKKAVITWCLIVAAGIISCEKIQPGAPLEEEILDGPVDGLSEEQNRQFLRGDIAFNDEIFTTQSGLGPLFVSNSCFSCHAGDGKGHLSTTLTRFGQTDETGNKYLGSGGPQLQNRAIAGHQPEQLPHGATFSRFTPPANTGLGFLDAVSDETIMELADPGDKDGDGISGVPNWIILKNYTLPRRNAVKQQGRHIGRFGKKAGAYDLLQQTATAYNEDMGIVSTYEPFDTYTGQGLDPEISNQKIIDVVFYLQTLKAPVQRNAGNTDVVRGKELFLQVSCGKCHLPELKTGYSSIPALSNKTFYPYTDLLMHDMGKDLDDGYTEGTAKTFEWRTPPLWGLGLSKNSQGGAYFLMHDGRARSIEEAILMHGGEAAASRDRYKALTEEEQKKIILFLESL